MNQRLVPTSITPEDWAATPASVRAWIDELRLSLQQMQERVRELEQRLNQNSQNSSTPPARDRKARRPQSVRRPRRGGKPGHVKAERAWVETPDAVIPVPLTSCTHCQSDLRAVEPTRFICRQITELPAIQPLVLETRQAEGVCPVCHSLQRASLPAGLEAERRFGPRAEALVIYLQHQQHMSYERTGQTLTDVFSLDLSQGGQACILERAGVAAAAVAESIRSQVQQSAVVGCDETGARVDGQTWWQWVFVAPLAIYHVIVHSRAAGVIQAMMGKARPEVWVSDCWSPQFHAPAQQFQICLVHQLRNLQGLIERHSRLRWPRQMQQLFRSAMPLSKRRERLSATGYALRVQVLERRLDRLLQRCPEPKAAHALYKRYVKHRQHLFVFLYDPRVPFHNNACERALRPAVIHRKVIGGFRSEWGAQAYAALSSVIDTAKLQERNVFQTLVDLMGEPVLPFFTAQARE
jgi:transposase